MRQQHLPYSRGWKVFFSIIGRHERRPEQCALLQLPHTFSPSPTHDLGPESFGTSRGNGQDARNRHGVVKAKAHEIRSIGTSLLFKNFAVQQNHEG